MAVWGRCWWGAIIVMSLAWVEPAASIPVFARIYDKPCSACHTVYPQLNPAGEYFRAKGLHGMEPKIEPIHIGAGLEVPGTLPLAVALAAGEDISRAHIPGVPDSTEEHFNLEFLALLAGGELGPHLAFLADYAPLFSIPQTGDLETNHNLGMGFLQAHAEPWGWLMNLKAGLIELPLGTSPRVHRLSTQSYLVYGTTASSFLGKPRRADTLVLSQTQMAVEVSGLQPASGRSFALGISNGTNNLANGKEEKDVYVRLGQGWGLHRAGFFAYCSPNFLRRGPNDWGLRLGPDANLYWRQAGLRAQFLASYDAHPTGNDADLWSYGTFVEGEYRWTSSIVTLARVEYAAIPTFDDRDEGGTTRVRRRLWQATAGAQWLPFENLKLIAEVSYGDNHEGVSDRSTDSWFFTIRAATAFWPLTPPGLDVLMRRGEDGT